MSSPTVARRCRLPALLLALLVVLLALSGCARVRAALAVQPDDTVSGEIVLATPESPESAGPTYLAPPALAGDVDVAPYRQEGYAGSVVRFTGITFPQVAELIAAAGEPGNTVRLELRRAGNRVVLSGSVDLTTADADLADFQLKISFPGQVLDANGDADSGTVGWTFEAGRVGDVEAVVAIANPDAPSPVNWTLGLAAAVAAVTGLVVLLARRTRNPPVGRTR